MVDFNDALAENTITIYTDGSCHNKTGHGGWGAVILLGGATVELSGTKGNTTSNVMEMTAVFKALKALDTAKRIIVYTDSQYVQRGMTKGFRNITKNQGLWKKLATECAKFHYPVDVRWVKGHAGNEGNERADTLAGEAMAKGREMRLKK